MTALFQTVTTLGAMAALTGRIHIGVLVNGVLYRDPVTLAKSAATADQISEGRFVFSLGAAWARGEFKPYGLAFPSLAERYGRLEESLEMVKSLWPKPRATFEGRYYRVEDAPCGRSRPSCDTHRSWWAGSARAPCGSPLATPIVLTPTGRCNRRPSGLRCLSSFAKRKAETTKRSNCHYTATSLWAGTTKAPRRWRTKSLLARAKNWTGSGATGSWALRRR